MLNAELSQRALSSILTPSSVSSVLSPISNWPVAGCGPLAKSSRSVGARSVRAMGRTDWLAAYGVVISPIAIALLFVLIVETRP